MIVVADTSPLVVLAKTGDLEVLPALFQQVMIPPEVVLELQRIKWPVGIRNLGADPPAWLHERAAVSQEPIPNLHSGEAAAIHLAIETNAEIILIDERLGRRAAEARGLRVLGVVGVMETAARAGMLDLREAFERVKKTDFWITNELLEENLRRFLEQQSRRFQ
jgi:predicted nucleic acid-binding protein